MWTELLDGPPPKRLSYPTYEDQLFDKPMNDFVLSLADPLASDPALTGSKGAALAKMTAAKFPVPTGFAITTTAFESVVAGLGDGLAILSDSTSASENAVEKASTQARRLILGAGLPRGAVSRIRYAWKTIGSPAVSVRSSSTAEDLADASFAGQYDSYLNVTSFKELLEKIGLVWASLHSPHVIGYRRRNGMSHQDARMAVVVQTQLSPDAAGVMFTRDPVTGKNQFVISAALGLGEGVVSGTAQTDRFVLRPRAGTLLSSEVSPKKHRVVASSRGGIRTAATDAATQERPALTKDQLAELAAMGRDLVDLFGAPQDVEFATVDGKIQLLQSRPMTAIEADVPPDAPWDGGLDSKFTWQRRSGPLFRLEQDVAVERLRHLKDCYDETGSSMAANHIGHMTNGYLYVRANEVGERTLKKRHKIQTEKVDASLERGKSYFEDVLQAIVEARLLKLKMQRAAARTFADQIDCMAASIETMGYVQGNLHWRQGKPGGRRDWHKAFSEITGEPGPHANVFVQAIQNRMTRLITRIRELARIAQSDPELRRLFVERDFDALTEVTTEVTTRAPTSTKRAPRQQMKRFRSRFKAMLRVYGLRAGHGYGSELNFATETWNMDHTLPFGFIATYVEQDLEDLDRRERDARAERVDATKRMRRKLAGDPEKLERFDRALAEAIIGVRFLEDHNYFMEQCTIGTMRESIFAVGREIVIRDQIDHADDVFHFSIDELKQIATENPQQSLRDRVLERTEELARRQRMKPPATLGLKPESTDSGNEEEKPAGLDGNLIRGASASSGRATGRAVIALPGKERPRLHPGDILVAPNVGPDWTPAFAIIGGLVLDSGSLSQHAALVAREYRIPSVMQTKEASRVITDGQTITVDGDAGIVELKS
jgi:pyruvate,water dikinase